MVVANIQPRAFGRIERCRPQSHYVGIFVSFINYPIFPEEGWDLEVYGLRVQCSSSSVICCSKQLVISRSVFKIISMKLCGQVDTGPNLS